MSDDVMKIGESLPEYEKKLSDISVQLGEARTRVEKVIQLMGTGEVYEGVGLESFYSCLDQLYNQVDVLKRQYKVASIYVGKTYETMNITDKSMATSIQSQE